MQHPCPAYWPDWCRANMDANWIADNCPCAVCRGSRPDRSGPRVLAGAIPPRDASLIGLVVDCAKRNHLPRTSRLLDVSAEVPHAYVNLAVRDDVDFAQLAWSMRVAPHEVEARRFRHVAITPHLPGVGFFGATIPRYDLSLRSRRFAPAQPGSTAIHNAIGHHGLIPHCPVSGDWLVEACPKCRAVLGWTAAEPIHLCEACGYDLRTGARNRFTREEVDGAALMVGLIHPDPTRRERELGRLHADLAAEDRGAVFELGWRLGCVLTGTGLRDRDRAKRLPEKVRMGVLVAGSKALARWPTAITEAIAHRVAERGGDAGVAIASDFRAIYRASNGWPALETLVRRATPELAVSAAASVKAAVPGGANTGQALAMLGVGQRRLGRVLASNALAPLHASGSTNHFRTFAGPDLDPVRHALEASVSHAGVAQALGIGRHGVEQLCFLGELDVVDDELVRSLHLDRQVTRESVDRLSASIERRKTDLPPADTLLLRRAMVACGGREKPWGPVLVALARGRVAFGLDADQERPLVRRISVPAAEVGKLLALAFEPIGDAPFESAAAITATDAQELLNVTPNAWGKALRSGGLVECRRDDGSFDRAALVSLAAERISSSEILMRWMGGGLTMPSPLKGPNALVRVDHLGWDRRNVEEALGSRREHWSPEAVAARATRAPTARLTRETMDGDHLDPSDRRHATKPTEDAGASEASAFASRSEPNPSAWREGREPGRARHRPSIAALSRSLGRRPSVQLSETD